ncbi:hypothetical protein MYMAC_006531 [Corallococcus macrosporus DSM 14697]|uniref:Uncharacterized protein n=1 Tax=Corallococcus macrosporus DSM 14697 TaxID=1189310 RepID=A0A250K457_9BACT|nr:hypothetical protein MYMAC_006531 [Corallococcus macrosporus DSM 14697]
MPIYTSHKPSMMQLFMNERIDQFALRLKRPSSNLNSFPLAIIANAA